MKILTESFNAPKVVNEGKMENRIWQPASDDWGVESSYLRVG